jgi:small-conductance mechanosensitive channel
MMSDTRFVVERLRSAETTLVQSAREIRRLADDLHYEGQRRLAKGDDRIATLSNKAHDLARELEQQAANLGRMRRWLVSRLDDEGTSPGIKRPEDPSA